MKKIIFHVLAILTLLPIAQVGCQSTTTSGGVEVSNNVIKVADLFNYKYTAELEKAKAGDYKALIGFLDFHRKVDNADGLSHAITTLELIPVVGDVHFAAACQVMKPKLKALVYERLMAAQNETKNEALKKPLTEWAPATWGDLNGKPVGHGAEKERAAAEKEAAGAAGAGLQGDGSQKPGAAAPEAKPKTPPATEDVGNVGKRGGGK
jgi:hypothetical protein